VVDVEDLDLAAIVNTVAHAIFPRRARHSPSNGFRSGAPTVVRPAGSPYRGPLLWRIHAVSALLVVPQFAVATYALVFLVDIRRWHPATAGALLAAAQIGGAATRLAAGHWSDRVGSRLGPMRVLAMVIGLVVAALALGAATGSALVTVALFAAGIVTVSTSSINRWPRFGRAT
jgi:predicted MFS family arabinose efflux permease